MNAHGISKTLPGRAALKEDLGASFVFKSLGVKEIRLPLGATHEQFYCIKSNMLQGM